MERIHDRQGCEEKQTGELRHNHDREVAVSDHLAHLQLPPFVPLTPPISTKPRGPVAQDQPAVLQGELQLSNTARVRRLDANRGRGEQ